MKGSSSKMKFVVPVDIIGPMEKNMKVCGNKIKCMAKVL